ncbi:hypothetical protein BDY24DRAFT_389683 [Mrakia frigida]|uniref:uncharacterized protein n=1 Tax=Mrakia frigida TaxID=29902 RepID=UPI003FCC088D
MPPRAADDSLLSNSSASSVESASQAATEEAGDETRSSSGQSTPAIDPDQPVDEVASEGLDGPSNPGSDNGSDAHLNDDEFREKMDRDVLRLGEVTEEEGKKIKREEWLAGVRAAALAAAPSSSLEKDGEKDGEETEDGARQSKAQAEAAFLLQSHRYLTKQLRSLEQDDWKFDSSSPLDEDRLFVPSFGGNLDMAAGKAGEKDQSGLSMEVVDEEEVWGRGTGGR